MNSEKDRDTRKHKDKCSRPDEGELKRKRNESRENKSQRNRERHRKDKYDERDRKHKSSMRSRSRSPSDKSSKKRSRTEHGHRNEDPHSRRHHKSRSRSREYNRGSRREHKGDFNDHVDKKTQEILRNIEIPKEIRQNRDLVSKYQSEQLKKKAEEITGVKIPTFYNTSNVNPLVLAEQQRKRKLLWSKSKDNENTSTQQVGKAILQGQDEKTAEKFRKLMGIKSMDQLDQSKTTSIQSMQQEAFDSMDKEYEYARVTTHLNRGKGLGFASHAANLLFDANQRLQFQ